MYLLDVLLYKITDDTVSVKGLELEHTMWVHQSQKSVFLVCNIMYDEHKVKD